MRIFKQEGIMESPFTIDENTSNFPHSLDPSTFVEFDDINIMSPLGENGPFILLSPPQDETRDIATEYEQPTITQPVSPRGPPERNNFPGSLNFVVEVNAVDTHKKKYLYSHKLNRIYVDMKCNFPVQFNWDQSKAPSPMFVRATVVFSDESQAEKRVERCVQHEFETHNSKIDLAIVKNVLHSARELGTQGVYYCGDSNLADSWYSVLVQVGSSSGGPITHAYQFVCKNSCSTGINRRSIDIIFTLEDNIGRIHGRQSVGARVCACPRRDMLRDQDQDLAPPPGTKRRAPTAPTAPTTPRCKKVKIEPGHLQVITLPPLEIIGSNTVATGYEMMARMMELAASSKQDDPQLLEEYNKRIALVRSAIEGLNTKNQ